MKNMVRLLVLAVTAALVLTAAPAQAANGGCRTRIGGGWQIAVCSADDGVWMYPDFWVDIRPPFTGTCEIRSYIYLEDSPGAARPYESFSCWTNHGVARPVLIQGYPWFVDFYHHVRVLINGSVVFSGRGPATNCC